MKQLSQNYRTGKLSLTEVPVAAPKPGHVLVRTVASLVSVGTERSMVELARKSLLGKALARPDLVRQVIAKAQSDGIVEAWKQAMGRLDTPVPLGYSSAGVVSAVGPGVEGFVVGERVACTGQGYAGHTEVASVPTNLCAKVPEGVDFDSAAFVALGGIALEAARMARVSLGETVVVIGLGLLGQIAVQVLKAAGCRVIGMDIDTQKAELARRHGATATATDYHELATACNGLTAGDGADAVIILATAPSNEPLERAAELCRERGRVVAAGQVGLEVPRKPFYDKELELVVSRGWGPGMYDARYTEKGIDYPIGYARWTANRNAEEFLRLLDGGAVRVDELITHRFPLERASDAYEMVLEGEEPYIGVLLTYPQGAQQSPRPAVVKSDRASTVVGARGQAIGIGLIGAGLFARGTLLPILSGMKAMRLRGVATSTGLSARHMVDKYGFEYCATDYRELLDDPQIDLVLVLTRHGSHAPLVVEALTAGKHVFVEKPLALNRQQLEQVGQAYDAYGLGSASNRLLMVGYNRRYSPCARWLKGRFASAGEPLAVHCTVNAGALAAGDWTYDADEGGGRIIGEVCHFVDLVQYFTASTPARVYCETLSSGGYRPSDNVVITLKMAEGAIGSVTYVAGGDKRFPREHVEVFGGGAVGTIANFKGATFTQGGRGQRLRRWLGVDRGYRSEMELLCSAIRDGGPPPTDFSEYVYTSLATFAAEEALGQGMPIELHWP